ncbi:hypothetical protein C1M55_12015 [Rhodococcus qingshengii]|uniref:hypothetical protein n=1 Tax=Rhodococcus TaxID=1827 RepID=UPI0009768A1B|nr:MULTISPECIES: hypothetical protein [Rhodococcus]AUS31697.1 hypothetical protein C1M55_11645 [Rhodococcus qingshengii]AUS31762.1 hypothetical protein C1M55_12015 [Rhodococcus qingshengii]MCC4304215.1 hypothetical protein [Rhodococcus sp. 3-2]OMQ36718.1 hypothetical protein BK799_08980 [Rhodococcus sp. D-1]
MSEIRSQATPARDELAEAIKGYGKSFLGECEEVDVAKIEHSFDCMADGLADYLTEDDGWSKPRTVNSAADLDALPVGSVVRELDDAPSVFEKVACEDETGWEMPGDLHWYTPGEIALPATVLFTPGDAG